MRRGPLPLLVLALWLSACSDGDPESDPVSSSEANSPQAPVASDAAATTELRAAPGGLLVPECDDVEVDVEATCALGFVLDDGVFHALGCEAIKNSLVTERVLGRGQFEAEFVTVNAIEGVDRSLMVAVSLPGGLCTGEPDEQALSNWTMAFPDRPDNSELLRAICSVGELTDAQRQANGC